MAKCDKHDYDNNKFWQWRHRPNKWIVVLSDKVNVKWHEGERNHTEGNPKLSPIPPKADTSSKRTRNRSNHFFDSSSRLARSMIATRKTPQTSHQMSGKHSVEWKKRDISRDQPIDICRLKCHPRYLPIRSRRVLRLLISLGSSSSSSGGASNTPRDLSS